MGENTNLKPVDVELDDILYEVGVFGKYQYIYFFLLLLPVLITSIHSTNYIFAAPDTEYRCKVPLCEGESEGEFNPDWLENAIPKGDKCQMYDVLENTFLFWKTEESTCPKDWFNTSKKVPCEEYVFKEQHSFVEEMGIACENDKRALIGTMHSVGTLLALPITGYASDRFGRKIVLVVSCALEGLFGLIKSFSVNYWMYASLELIEPTLGSAVYGTAYVLALEFLVPKHRALAGTIINIAYGIGQVIMAAVAMAFPYWKTFLRITYTPMIFLVVYQFIIDESPRWLLSKNHYQKVVNIIHKIAKINGKPVKSDVMEGLLFNASNVSNFEDSQMEFDDNANQPSPYIQVLKSKTLTIRLAMCTFWWITCVFCFYGLSINAVTLAGSVHLNYILFSLTEIPAHTIGMFAMNSIGRKWTLFIAFIIGGLSSLAFAFMVVNPDLHWVSMVTYFISKMFVTLVFSSIYLYTSEIFPTNLRHSLMSFCSMMGRIGSIVAPLTPLLMDYMEQLPSILFGSTCIISAILTLFTPETLHLRLPETVEEAENMECLRITKEEVDSKSHVNP